MWKKLWKLLCDQRGQEGEAAAEGASAEGAGAGEGEGAGEGGEGGAGAGPGDSGAGEGGAAGDGTQPKPKFGEFGDDPVQAATKLLEVYNKTQGDFTNFKNKASLTERNLGALRKTLEGSGIQIVEDKETGQVRLEVAKAAEKKSRFTEQHGKLFDQPVIEAIRLLVQDIFDEQYEGRERTTKEQRAKMQQFLAEKQDAEDIMLGYFPQLDPKYGKDGKPTNAEFNQAFFARATEIWETEYLMPNGKPNPLKQLSAALKAAKELNIIPQMIEAAKKEGVKIGKDGKRILGPVGGAGAGAGAGAGGFRKLSREEYLALPSEKKLAYDKWETENRVK
jgi:hypothetical protein